MVEARDEKEAEVRVHSDGSSSSTASSIGKDFTKRGKSFLSSMNSLGSTMGKQASVLFKFKQHQCTQTIVKDRRRFFTFD